MYLLGVSWRNPSHNARPILSKYRKDLPLLMTFFSAHHSPKTVNKKAKEFVIGTVRLNSSPITLVFPLVQCPGAITTYQPAQSI